MKVYHEAILPTTLSAFLVRRFEEKHFSSPFHNHREIELTYIVQSSGTRMVGDQIEHFAAGDLCLIGENLPHVYRSAKGSKQAAISEVLHFQRELGKGLFDQTPELAAFARLLDHAQQGLVFDPRTAAEVGRNLPLLRQETGTARWRLFFEIVDRLTKAENVRPLCSPGYRPAPMREQHERIHEVCNYILEHHDKPLSHEDMARRIHVTRSHFSRIFKRATKRTYQEFVNEVRLGHACRLLVETDESITEIALNSGFNNLSNFNRRFRQKYRCSPREYRGKLDQGANDA